MAFVCFRQSPPPLFGVFRFMAGSTYSVPDRLVDKYVKLQGVAQEVDAVADDGKVAELPQGFTEHWEGRYGEVVEPASPEASEVKVEADFDDVVAADTDDTDEDGGEEVGAEEAAQLPTHPDNAPFSAQHKNGPWFEVVNVLGDVVSTSSMRKTGAQEFADALNAGQVDSGVPE